MTGKAGGEKKISSDDRTTGQAEEVLEEDRELYQYFHQRGSPGSR